MSLPFIESLLSAPQPLVMEVKRRDAFGFDLISGHTPAEIVTAYEKAGAPCISVVTGRWFGGTRELLRDVARLTELPCFRRTSSPARTSWRPRGSSVRRPSCSPPDCSPRPPCAGSPSRRSARA